MAILEQLERQGVKPGRLTADSRRVQPGDVFVAFPGAQADGRDFIAQAVARGAAAVVAEAGSKVGAGNAVNVADFPVVEVDGLSRLCGELANLVYGRPSGRLWLAGVTGTNGKTSVSQWIGQAMARHGRKCGIIGTLGNGFPGALIDSPNTTPDGIALHAQLARFVAAGAQAAAMEVSSIGLEQGRTDGARFEVAVFTNLTRDHLDYHGTMEAYAAAKARLFEVPDLRAAVINLDDAFGKAQAQRLLARGCTLDGYTLNADPVAPCPLRTQTPPTDGSG